MPQELAQMLKAAIDRDLPALRAMAADVAAVKPARKAGWSRKEELGHLIDSATNNHVRFARAALDAEYHGPSYDGDGWVALHGYQGMNWGELVDLWERYNLLLTHLIGRIPREKLGARCVVGSSPPVTLGFLIEDYVVHMQHHLDHVLGRGQITEYPRSSASA